MKAGAPETIRLRQLRTGDCLSYVLADVASGEALVVDPHPALLEEYRGLQAALGAKRFYGFDTARHRHHASAAGELESWPGVQGRLGMIELRALETPGVAPEARVLHAPELGLLFSGDTLRVGATGEPGLADVDAGAHWRSLSVVLGALPDETRVLPGHERGEMLFTTIGIEKKRNTAWSGHDERSFVEHRHTSAALQDETAPGARAQGEGAISASKLEAKLRGKKDAGVLYLDVREPDEFRAGHLPGTENLPLSELALAWPTLARARRITLICLTGRRSHAAARTLSYLGMPDVLNLTGGVQAWQQGGGELVK